MSATTTTAVKELPILFNGPMVRAIRAGRKTQTRRPVKPQPSGFASFGALPTCDCHPYGFHDGARHYPSPYGKPGDRLWVRESLVESRGIALYAADREPVAGPDDGYLAWSWRRSHLPSIHMPRWAARLILEVTDVRVERLQDISEADAMAEGVDWSAPQWWGEPPERDEDPREVGYPPAGASFARDNFRRLWESIDGDGSWYANPWVWAVSFRVLDGLA